MNHQGPNGIPLTKDNIDEAIKAAGITFAPETDKGIGGPRSAGWRLDLDLAIGKSKRQTHIHGRISDSLRFMNDPKKVNWALMCHISDSEGTGVNKHFNNKPTEEIAVKELRDALGKVLSMIIEKGLQYHSYLVDEGDGDCYAETYWRLHPKGRGHNAFFVATASRVFHYKETMTRLGWRSVQEGKT